MQEFMNHLHQSFRINHSRKSAQLGQGCEGLHAPRFGCVDIVVGERREWAREVGWRPIGNADALRRSRVRIRVRVRARTGDRDETGQEL